MKLLIAGDIYISDEQRRESLIDSTIIDVFQKVDYRIVNLEAPITSISPTGRILKTGPHLQTSQKTIIPYLNELRVDLVTLANNHIMDYGVDGLVETINTLQDNNIGHVGAGNNLLEAQRPVTIIKDGLKVAILNFAENEWSIASDDSPGCNPLDVIDNVNQIQMYKATHDKVICIIHGGHEYYHMPSPRMVKQYRFYVDSGADAIIGHHTHCIGGYENYSNAPIVYSLGNMLFTKYSKHQDWYEGLIVIFDIQKEKPISLELSPVQQSVLTYRCSLANESKSVSILNRVEEISACLQNDVELEKAWQEYAKQMSPQYLNYFSPIQLFNNRYINYVIKKLNIERYLMSKSHYKLLLNIIRCEAHKDMAISTLKTYIER